MLALGLVLGGVGMLAHYASADATNTDPIGSSASAIDATKAGVTEENDAAEKAAERAMTPAQKAAKEATESAGGDGDGTNMNDGKDGAEMNDARESTLTPAEKAAHDASEAAEGHDGGSEEAND